MFGNFIVQGLNASFDRQLATIGANTLYISKWPWVIRGDWWIYRNRKNFTLPMVEQIRAQSSYVTAISPPSKLLSRWVAAECRGIDRSSLEPT